MKNASLNTPPPRWPAQKVGARTLAGMLRRSPLTVLCGPLGAERANVLRDGVMPLLQRRASDSPIAFDTGAAVELPFPDRRRAAAVGEGGPAVGGPAMEVAVLMDNWLGQPVDELHAQLGGLLCIAPLRVAAAGDTLLHRLDVLNKRFGVRFLLIFDRFEDALRAADAAAGGCRGFVDELVALLGASQPAAHVLLSVADDALPLLNPLRERLSVSDEPVRLSPEPAAAASGGTPAGPATAPPQPRAAPGNEPQRPTVRLVTPSADTARAEPNLSLDTALPAATRAAAAPTDKDWTSSIETILARIAGKANPAAHVPDIVFGPLFAADDGPTRPIESAQGQAQQQTAGAGDRVSHRPAGTAATAGATGAAGAANGPTKAVPVRLEKPAADAVRATGTPVEPTPQRPAAPIEVPAAPPRGGAAVPERVAAVPEATAAAASLAQPDEVQRSTAPHAPGPAKVPASDTRPAATAPALQGHGQTPASASVPVPVSMTLSIPVRVLAPASTSASAPHEAPPRRPRAADEPAPPSPPVATAVWATPACATAPTAAAVAPPPAEAAAADVDKGPEAATAAAPRADSGHAHALLPPDGGDAEAVAPAARVAKRAWTAVAVAASVLAWLIWASPERAGTPPIASSTVPAIPSAAPPPPPVATLAAPSTAAPAPSTEPPSTAVAALPPTAAGRPAAPVDTSLPTIGLAVDGDDVGAARLASDLAQRVGLPAGINLKVEPASGWADTLAAPRDGQRLAIARYDALAAMRRESPGAAVRLVTPLVSEELYFIVRADSPLNHVHDIERATRINVGPAQGGRAVTAQTVYQRLFDHPMLAGQASFANRDAALRELLVTRGVDVIVVVDPQPSAWLGQLSPAQLGAVKLLPVAIDHPTTTRARRTYLPAMLQAGAGAAPVARETPTLSVMSFLVATGESAGADGAALKAGDDPAPRTAPAGPANDLIARLAASLCRNLDGLRREGHPKWQELQPGLALPAGWPYVAPATASFRSCAGVNAAATTTPVPIESPTETPAASPPPRKTSPRGAST